jgi:hypothetical protein
LYDFAKNNVEEGDSFEKFHNILLKVIEVSKELLTEPILKNKLVFECILWAYTIIDQKDIEINFSPQELKKHFIENILLYSEDNAHYYSSIITRFSDTATLFERLTSLNFYKYIKDDSFKEKLSQLKQTEVDAAKSIEELSNLRLNKPNPISTPIDEIRQDLKTNRYLVRPSYQRQEKINIIKASSIVESILLGINLPPIFLFKRLSDLKEVVDGQQRLLAIIGFLGEQFNNEDGELKYSKNSNFKLKSLKVLTEFEGFNFNSLPEVYKDKILDFVIDLIIIEESVNGKFDPVDLFIRLNYKPYPIKSNSFEMWNSIVNNEVTTSVKTICNDETKNNWFFLRESKDGQPDRMLNEELVTILSYISYAYDREENTEDIIGFFPRKDRITCRLKNKSALTEFLVNELDADPLQRSEFLKSIRKINNLITMFGKLLGEVPSKELLNEVLNVKKSKTFRRSLQDFYVIWLIIIRITPDKFDTEKDSILVSIVHLLSLLRNTKGEDVNAQYIENFKTELTTLNLKQNTDS